MGWEKQTGRLAISSGNADGARGICSSPFPPVKVFAFAGRPTALGPQTSLLSCRGQKRYFLGIGH